MGFRVWGLGIEGYKGFRALGVKGSGVLGFEGFRVQFRLCLLYTSDAADEHRDVLISVVGG